MNLISLTLKGGDNVGLKLNGHSIKLTDSGPLTVANGDTPVLEVRLRPARGSTGDSSEFDGACERIRQALFQAAKRGK